MAYESKGSVYFDTNSFNQHPNHRYAKLVPEAFGDTNALDEGEGDLSDRLSEKKNKTDFALWKTSKPGEPAWDSPWGKGRPGWHIECSAMASDVLGDCIDIHTGGVDLRFPHHDNELAQSEAYYDNDEWVRYFLHSGHLTIAGCKMSKSLKNFITIQQALEKNSARQLRIAFLMHSWRDTLDYSQNTMDLAVQYEKSVNEFFLNIKDVLRSQPTGEEGAQTMASDDKTFQEKFYKLQSRVHEALCDNIDTASVLDIIRDLISTYNIYIKDKGFAKTKPNYDILTQIATYITRILNIFGATDSIKISSQMPTTFEEVAMPIAAALTGFWQEVRATAKKDTIAEILKACDLLKDNLACLGVNLEARNDGSTAIKLVDPQTILTKTKLKLDDKKQKAELQKIGFQESNTSIKAINLP
uniref:Cysteine--tRNA ligase, cytoplasmic n=1 Tax=Strigamia maritima TaxID=126957 RepID=T1IU98_STRMM